MSDNRVSKKLPEERLLAAVYDGDSQSVAALLGDADLRHPIFMEGKLLCAACNVPKCNASIVQQVLDHCCNDEDPDCQVYKGLALMVTVARGNPEIVQILLDRGADILGCSRFGVSPLHLACRHGNTAVVDLLVKRGAPVDDSDPEGCTPLFHAATYGHTDVVKTLIRAGCDLDAASQDGTSPLDLALTYKHRDITSLLLKGGCRFDVRKGQVHSPSNYRQSVLYHLIQDKDTENVRLLIECGYKVTRQGLQQMMKSPNSIQQRKDIVELLKKSAHMPRTLKSLCRIMLRRRLIINKRHTGGSLDRKVEQLPVALKLRGFLSMRT